MTGLDAGVPTPALLVVDDEDRCRVAPVGRAVPRDVGDLVARGRRRDGAAHVTHALVHDSSVSHPSRPGWSVWCADSDSYVDLTVSVVIPTYNEALNLPSVLLQIPRTGTELVIVDGRSTDGTVDIARELWPDVVLVDIRLGGESGLDLLDLILDGLVRLQAER